MTNNPLVHNSWESRLARAEEAALGAGAALMEPRGAVVSGIEGTNGQLKTLADMASEGWLVGFLQAAFSADLFWLRRLLN